MNRAAFNSLSRDHLREDELMIDDESDFQLPLSGSQYKPVGRV